MFKKLVQKKAVSAHKKDWKDIQSKKQTAKRTKLAFIALAVILGLVILGKGISLFKVFFTPWEKSPNFSRNYIWNGENNINVLIKAKEISLLNFSPQNQAIKIINIPDNTYIDVAKGFGKWQLSSIFGLGGRELLRLSLVDFFGLPIDGILYFSDKYSKKDALSIVSEIRKNPFSALNLLPYFKTDLTPFEIIRLKMGLSGVRFDKIKEVNLDKADLLSKDSLADGTMVYSSDPIKLDSVFFDIFDPLLTMEHKTIAVYNSTNHPNLAQKAARMITNLGGNVIITTNGQSNLKVTKVIGEKSKTLDRLKQIFEITCRVGKKDTNCDRIDLLKEDLVSSRTDISVFIGEDYFN